jgi:hypoxanthine phosphoribosyltransferase
VSSLLPDYYASTVRKWRWIIYPWAVTEDINGFINRMSPKPKTIDEIQARLVQDYGIKLPVKKIQEIHPLVSYGN